MTTTRAAKYLAPIDLGKTIQLLDRYTGNWPTGTLQEIDATQDALIRITIIAGKDSGTYDVHPDDEITITGKPSPTRQGEQPNTAYVRIEPQLAQQGIINGRQFIADAARALGNAEEEVNRILDGYDKSRPKTIEQSGSTGYANALEHMEQRALGAEANVEAALEVSRARLTNIEQAERRASQAVTDRKAAEQAVARVREVAESSDDKHLTMAILRALDGDGRG